MPRRTWLDFPTIDCLLAFESAVRHGSFSRAAEELDTGQPVISRHIARLEARVSARLFDRSRAGTRPTPTGERVHTGVSAGLDAIREGILRARAVTGEGRVVIACPPDVWQLLILPLLDALQDALGATAVIEVRVRSEDPDADVAFGWDGAAGAASVLTMAEAVGPVCAPGYAAAHADMLNGPVSGWGGLKFLDCASPGPGWATWEDWFAVAGRPSPAPRARRLGSYLAAVEAAVSGRGIALGRRRLVERHLGAGVLVALGDGFVSLGGGLDVGLTAKGRAKPLAREALAFFRAAIGGGPIAEGGWRPARGERI